MTAQRRRERPRSARRSDDRQKQRQKHRGGPRPAPGGGRPWLIPAGVTLGLLVVAAVIILLNHSSTPTPQPSPNPSAAASVVDQLSSVPVATLDKVGAGTSNRGKFAKISGEAPLGSATQPQVLYMGAEYCPYCAAERWSLIVALSRFGTFSGVQTILSGEGSLPTFTFRGARYTSQYLTFVSVEQADGSGKPLQKPTAQQLALEQKYGGGFIPFVDFNNALYVEGATYDNSVLTGSWQEIADALSSPSSPQSQGILGSANLITASICKVTGDQPGAVCSDPMIQGLEHQLPS